ncbi:DEAD/DEAH box helicase family protein [Fusobacterium sp. PH5-44]|uniref:DEAD/DEAH box helicase family protein n=1 Tax=unclassified Fusobacterium TaxID=2648384 RepID=UPI003D1E1040
MSNFNFLKEEKQFESFAEIAITAEKLYNINTNVCVSTCRQAMEFAIKWVYSVDSEIKKPSQETLAVLMSSKDFEDVMNEETLKRMNFIRKLGNVAIHDPTRQYSKKEAELALENLFYICDDVVYLYSKSQDSNNDRKFDKNILNREKIEPNNVPQQVPDINLEELIKENEALKVELTSRRKEHEKTHVPKPVDLSEWDTRKIYIDTILREVGWKEGTNWINEEEVSGMPNKSELGYVDYVLIGDNGVPLAIIEAKRTSVDPNVGEQQARLYAGLLEEKFGQMPIIFLTNGFDTEIIDNRYPKRKVSGIYSKRDLEKQFNKISSMESLETVQINDDISGRYYQKEAITKVCEAFEDNKRKVLLVMATGSGKTRTVISLVDVLSRKKWIKNILFLADRTSLVKQAEKAFKDAFGADAPTTNLVSSNDKLINRYVFSTYQTMINLIDTKKDDEGGKLFSCGHFDLIIVDEAHRSIYNKYKEIFSYFDSLLVGLTATPKDEIDFNTYNSFQLENGFPTFGYGLEKAVEDGYLVDYRSIETRLKFLEEGITYDKLSEEEKEQYEEKFGIGDDIPDKIENSALNEWVFNKNTIIEVLNILMTKGIKIEEDSKIGKTIIFAKNRRHANKIDEIFREQFPNLVDYTRVIDYSINYADSLIEDFKDDNKLPQIAISIDMLDTGIDVPSCVNLVFFKKVMSKAKFWQMIGRGTRLCSGLLNGEDKKEFYIFDFCGNFEYFRMGRPGKEGHIAKSIQERIFSLKLDICYQLQNVDRSTEFVEDYYVNLLHELANKVKELNRNNFIVRQYLKYVEKYSDVNSYSNLTEATLKDIKDNVAHLVDKYDDSISALRFDTLIFSMEFSSLAGVKNNKIKNMIYGKLNGLLNVQNIPIIDSNKDYIRRILSNDSLSRAGIEDLEKLREKLRDLMDYIPETEKVYYNTSFEDEIISMEVHEPDFTNNNYLDDYQARAESYIKEHNNEDVIKKLHTNMPLSKSDIKKLEKIMWEEIGTKKDYQNEIGAESLGVFVRKITGLDMNAAKKAFSKYLDESSLNANQIHFVNKIVEYVVEKGILEDKKILQMSPFSDRGSFADLFDTSTFMGIIGVIDNINNNAGFGGMS